LDILNLNQTKFEKTKNLNLIKKKINIRTYSIILLTSLQLIIFGCSKKKENSSGTPNGISEITQALGSDGYYTGSFVVPSNGISFLLSIFKDNNASIAFYSLTDPDGINILSESSSPNLYYEASGSTGNTYVSKAGYSNVLVPQSPNFLAKKGKWTFKAYNNDRVILYLRSGFLRSTPDIIVQPFITGSTWSANDLSSALSITSDIYSANDVSLLIKPTISISESQYAEVSGSFIDSTTSSLVSQGFTDCINLFFIEDYIGNSSGILGNASGMPGSMGIANSWNGVLISINAHASGSELDSQLLGETAAHEMGHQMGLFHTSESGGTIFDIINDTAECSITLDNDSNGIISAEECEEYGAENVMFWTSWSSSSRLAGKKQNNFSSHQNHVFKYSPIAQ